MVGSHHPLYFTVGWYLVIYFTIGFKSVSLSFTVGSPLADHFNMSSSDKGLWCLLSDPVTEPRVRPLIMCEPRVRRPRGDWTLFQGLEVNELLFRLATISIEKPTDVEISPDLLKKSLFHVSFEIALFALWDHAWSLARRCLVWFGSKLSLHLLHCTLTVRSTQLQDTFRFEIFFTFFILFYVFRFKISLVWLKAGPSLAALYTNGPSNPTSRCI